MPFSSSVLEPFKTHKKCFPRAVYVWVVPTAESTHAKLEMLQLAADWVNPLPSPHLQMLTASVFSCRCYELIITTQIIAPSSMLRRDKNDLTLWKRSGGVTVDGKLRALHERTSVSFLAHCLGVLRTEGMAGECEKRCWGMNKCPHTSEQLVKEENLS